MKIDFEAEILDTKGKPIKVADMVGGMNGADGALDLLTLRSIAETSLLTQFADDQALGRGEKNRRYKLFVKIAGGATELDVDEAKMLKDCIAKYQPILIMGRAFDLIEGTGKEGSQEPADNEESNNRP